MTTLRPWAAVLLFVVPAPAQTVLASLTGGAAGEFFGASLCGLGDVDGDGVPDLAVGAPGAAAGVGAVKVLSGFDFHILYVVVGNAPGEGFGGQVGRLGDVDADGVQDFVAAAPTAAGGGYIRTVSGATGATIRTTAAPGPGANFTLLSAGGDFDGDGFGDFCARANLVTHRLVVYSGATGATIFIVSSASYGGVPGMLSAAFFPDLDQNGADELLIGIPGFCPPTCYLWTFGAVYLAGGPSGALLATYQASSPLQLGNSVGYAGDVDADGLPDATFGTAPFYQLPGFSVTSVMSGQTGQVLYSLSSSPFATQVFPGAQAATVAALGDVDADGHDDFAVGTGGPAAVLSGWPAARGLSVVSGATGAAIYTLAGGAGTPSLGLLVVANGGDLTLDGRAELAYGDSSADAPFTDAGSVTVVSLTTAPAASAVALGGGCGALPGGPVLTATPPVIGGAVSFALTNATPFAVGNLAFDFGLDVPTPLGAGCTFHLDPLHASYWVFIPIATDAAGAVAFPLPIPVIPLLAGLPVTVQTFLFATGGPLGFDLSNGLRTTLGY